jgi:hypothetical protein
VYSDVPRMLGLVVILVETVVAGIKQRCFVNEEACGIFRDGRRLEFPFSRSANLRTSINRSNVGYRV